MTITSTTLTRGAGVAAVAAGLIFIGVQINHPHADVTAVTTTEWAVRNSLKVLMAALVLVGITGMYLRQVKQTGVLGLLGYLVFSIGYLLIMSTTVISAYVLPSVGQHRPRLRQRRSRRGDRWHPQRRHRSAGRASSRCRASPTWPAAWSSASRCSARASSSAGQPYSSPSVASSASRSR